MIRIRSIITICLAAGLMACAGPERQAGEDFEPERVSIPEYREFLGELRESLEEGEPRTLHEEEMERYEEIDEELMALLADHDDVEGMSQDERRELFNLHEELQALVAGREQDQVICRRQHTVGTHFQTEQCRTRSEWAEAQDRSREFLRRSFRGPSEDPMGN